MNWHWHSRRGWNPAVLRGFGLLGEQAAERHRAAAVAMLAAADAWQRLADLAGANPVATLPEARAAVREARMASTAAREIYAHARRLLRHSL